jgi:predicted ATPase
MSLRRAKEGVPIRLLLFFSGFMSGTINGQVETIVKEACVFRKIFFIRFLSSIYQDVTEGRVSCAYQTLKESIMNRTKKIALATIVALAMIPMAASAVETRIARFGVISDTHVTDKGDQSSVIP